MPTLDPWMAEARCRQDPNITEIFFPPEQNNGRLDERLAAQAKVICQECPVGSECLDYALTHRMPFGIWGGLTTRERRRLLRKHRPRATVTRADWNPLEAFG